jgi:hypothetical protein
MYCNRRTACGTDYFYCPVNQYISKQVPMCRNVVKEMLSRIFYDKYSVFYSYEIQAELIFQVNVI